MTLTGQDNCRSTAKWIQLQVKKIFGKNSQYLVDFYHLCEYLAAAVPKCTNDKEEDVWIEEQKALFKNRSSELFYL